MFDAPALNKNGRGGSSTFEKQKQKLMSSRSTHERRVCRCYYAPGCSFYSDTQSLHAKSGMKVEYEKTTVMVVV